MSLLRLRKCEVISSYSPDSFRISFRLLRMVANSLFSFFDLHRYFSICYLFPVIPSYHTFSISIRRQQAVPNKQACLLPQLILYPQFLYYDAGFFFPFFDFEGVGDNNHHDGNYEGAPDGNKEDDDPAKESLGKVVTIPHSGDGHLDQP